MNDTTSLSGKPQLTAEEFKRAWHSVTLSGWMAMAYFTVCTLGAPRVKFLTELHATPFDFGLIAAEGSLMLLFQVFGGILINHVRRRRPIWMLMTIAHRLMFLGVVAAPFLVHGDRSRVWLIIGFLVLHDALGNLGGPLWLSWMADLIPGESFNRHWAIRQRSVMTFNVLFSIAMALTFNYFEQQHLIILGFTLLAIGGVICGVIDVLLFFNVPDLPHERVVSGDLLRTLIQPLRDKDFRPFLRFMSYWHFVTMIAAPFFSLYLIQELKLSVLTVQVILLAEGLGVVAFSKFWGLICDTYGARPALQMAVAGKALLPLVYILTPNIHAVAIPALGIATFFDGVMNGGIMLAMQGVLLQASPRRNRAMYIAVTNFMCIGLCGGLGPVLSGAMITGLNKFFLWDLGIFQFNGFHFAFALSLVLRLGSYRLAGQIHAPNSIPVRTVLDHLKMSNPIWVVRMIYKLHESPDAGRRATAARTLGIMRSPLAINELIQALQDASKAVRETAAEALGKIGHAEASQPLARALCDPRWGIQSPAARALGKIGGADSLKALLGNLNGLDEEALGETIDSLAHIGDDAAILPLICLFEDVDSPALRRKIAGALSRLGAADSAEDMMSVLSVGTPAGGRY